MYILLIYNLYDLFTNKLKFQKSFNFEIMYPLSNIEKIETTQNFPIIYVIKKRNLNILFQLLQTCVILKVSRTVHPISSFFYKFIILSENMAS